MGNSIMLVSGLGWSIYAISNKALSDRMSGRELLIPMLFLATLSTGLVALITRNPIEEISAESIAALVVLGVASTGGGFFLIDFGMRRLSAGLLGTITGATPIVNLLVAHWTLGEPLGPSLIVSGLTITVGLALIVQSERSRKD